MKKLFCSLVFLALVTAYPAAADPGFITIEFDPPTSREDGTPLDPVEELDFYTMNCGAEGSDEFEALEYTFPANSAEGVHEVNAAEVFPERGTFDCVLRATDTDGLWSNYSSPTPVEYPPSPPMQPTNVLQISTD